jgi:hypothetical protein
LSPGRFAHKHLPLGRQSDIAWKGFAAERDPFRARDDDGASTAQDGGRGIGGTEINADDGHASSPHAFNSGAERAITLTWINGTARSTL